MTFADDLRAYLTMTASVAATLPRPPDFQYACYEALVLAVGQPWTAAPRPPGVTRGPMRYCYHNTLALCRQRPDLRYVEGYAVTPQVGVPVQHAWAVDAEGRVIDRTWPDPAHCAYYGIVFRLDEVERFSALSLDTFGILPTEYIIDTPLLRFGELRLPDVGETDAAPDHLPDPAEALPPGSADPGHRPPLAPARLARLREYDRRRASR